MTDFTERIAILSAKEIRDLYGLPRFSQEERRLYFSMDPEEQRLALSHRFLTTRLFFILQIGYFKARRMFFFFSGNEVGEDFQFIMDSHFSGQPLLEILEINRVTRWKQQQRILSLFDYRTIYILKYVDNLFLRQSVQKLLNRGEGYHQLRRAIAHENAGKLRVDTEEEQNVWNECGRLVANAIIFFNSYILTRLLEQMEENNKTDIVDRIKKVSPIAWGHINLGGRFKLTCQNETINIEQMIARLKESMVRFAS